MKLAVIGAGAWGMPAAAQLARRGHSVTLVEAFEVGHPSGSSSGDSRLWRVSHTEELMVRLAARAIEAWRRLEADTATSILLQRGLLWRGSTAPLVATALRGADIAHTEVAAADVGKWFPGLRPTDADAVWQATAGTLFADVALQAHLQLFEQHGGRLLAHTRLVDIEKRHTGVRLSIQRTGMALATLDVDTVVLALGPWTPQFLARLGVDVVLEPVLEQVSYFDGAGFDGLPGFYDGPTESEPGLYSMPVPGVGYKVGLDQSIATFIAADLTRTPNAAMTHDIEARVSRDFDGLVPRATKSLVCSWTDSPDGRFIIDRVWDDHVVLACGDSGAGFKWSAFMGQVLADMAEGKAPDSDVATFGLARLANYDPTNHPVKFLQ